MVALPFFEVPVLLDLTNQVLLAVIGATALMLLTGFAGRCPSATPGCSPPAPSPPVSCSRSSAPRSG